ncbi:MAG: HAD family phosphatase [Actinomycetota bacterium]
MVSIEAVVFDVGGVLVESPFEAVLRWREVHDVPDEVLRMLFAEYARLPGPGEEPPIWHRVETGHVPMAEFVAYAHERMATELGPEHPALRLGIDDFNVFAGARPHPAVAERARELAAAGYRLAILTNNVREWHEWRSNVPLDVFDVVIDSSEVGLRKPDPAIYELVLSRLGVGAEQAVFLDDHPTNVEAAQALGMGGVVVTADLDGALAELDQLLDSAA